jgi:integrase
VFVGKSQKRLLSARHWFSRAVKKAGLTRFTWHDLRHTFASRLVMEGVDIVTVSKLLGHRSLAMTRRYSHLSPEHEQVAVERLNRYNF